MRIACVHLPQFPLQVALRNAPALRGHAVAVVGPSGERHTAPVVVACSRAARALGVRLGTTAVAARALGDELAVIPVAPDAASEVAHEIAEALLALAPRVDRGAEPRGTHHAAFAEVPVGCRGATFGARVITALAERDLVARVGIADDRFTAWAAASQTTDDAPVTTVPRGGSAAFLAPLPLSLLAIPPEVQHVLGVLGVHTLGEFAALPPPSVARAWDADYQQLARGEGGAELEPYVSRRRAAEIAGAPADAFRLTPMTPRLRDRRPTRGKHRPRVHTPAAQARLFAE